MQKNCTKTRIRKTTESILSKFIPKDFSIYEVSSAPALGIMPGSIKAVLHSVIITNKNNHPPIMGIAGESLLYKKGQLKIEKNTKIILIFMLIISNVTLDCEQRIEPVVNAETVLFNK